MGVNALQGAFGAGIQTAKGTAATTITYMPAASVNINPDQNAVTLPAEVGGSLWARESYKTGVIVTGDVNLNVRPKPIGVLLKAFAGDCTSVAEGVTGAYRHTFKEKSSDPANLPWLTVVRDIGQVWVERYTDCRVDSMRLDVPAAGIVTATFGFIGITPSGITQAPTTVESGPLFETCEGDVEMGPSGGAADAVKVNRFSFDFANSLTRDEQSVGSYFLDAITLVRRACRISMDVNIADASLYRQVYNNGDARDWKPSIYQAQAVVTIRTSRNLSGTVTTPGELKITIPRLDYQAMPVGLAGNDIVRATLSAELVLATGQFPFEIDLVSDEDTY